MANLYRRKRGQHESGAAAPSTQQTVRRMVLCPCCGRLAPEGRFAAAYEPYARNSFLGGYRGASWSGEQPLSDGERRLLRLALERALRGLGA